jgi:hypothetical protein
MLSTARTWLTPLPLLCMLACVQNHTMVPDDQTDGAAASQSDLSPDNGEGDSGVYPPPPDLGTVDLTADLAPDCGPEFIICNGSCVFPKTDNNNCGGCDVVCDSFEYCDDGECCGPQSCSAGVIWCGGCNDGFCADIQSDNANCGGCGITCDTKNGFSCTAGTCACPKAMTMCSGICVDLETDFANCGSCGNSCGGGDTCEGTLCLHMGLLSCNGTLVDIQTDESHCGGCNIPCDPNELCKEAICTAP